MSSRATRAVPTAQVGGLEFPNTAGCLPATAVLTISNYGSINATSGVSKNGRTIRGFSTGAQAKMFDSCPGCPYKDYQMAYNYYGDFDFGDKWVLAAVTGTATGFANNGNANFAGVSDIIRIEATKKGTVYM
eukprot:4539709-Prymnesium_polylepis.2